MLHWSWRSSLRGFIAGTPLGPCGFAGVLAPLLGFPSQCLGGPVQRCRRLGRDGCGDDERDLALVHELCCGTDHVDDGGAVVDACSMPASAAEE